MDWANWIGLVGIPLAAIALGRAETAQNRAREASQKRAEQNAKEHSVLHGRITDLSRELAAYREHVARDYATREMVEQMQRPLLDQLTRMDRKLDEIIMKAVK
jgi:hypothetical protein